MYNPFSTVGAQLLVHPGEDMKGDMIVVAAPRCSLLRVTEDLGLCKTYQDGNLTAFSYEDKDNFCNIGKNTSQHIVNDAHKKLDIEKI